MIVFEKEGLALEECVERAKTISSKIEIWLGLGLRVNSLDGIRQNSIE
jgi:hypothetical protein